MADLPAPVGSTARVSRPPATERMASSWPGRRRSKPKVRRARARMVRSAVGSELRRDRLLAEEVVLEAVALVDRLFPPGVVVLDGIGAAGQVVGVQQVVDGDVAHDAQPSPQWQFVDPESVNDLPASGTNCHW